MKKSLLPTLLAALFGTTCTLAQPIPNGDFEQWTTNSSAIIPYEDLTGWQTGNLLAGYGIPANVVKVTDAISGTYAAKVQNVSYTSLKKDTLYGFAETTFLANSTPQFFNGYYKAYMPPGETGQIMFGYKQKGSSVSYSTAYILIPTSQNNYTSFSLPIENPGITVDSFVVAVLSHVYVAGGSSGKGIPGAYVQVDNLFLSESPLGLEDTWKQNNTLKMLPNPTNGQIQVTLPVENADYELKNMEGKTMLEGKSEASVGDQLSLDLSGLPGGLYYLHMTTVAKSFIGKVILK
jgi:hypothetical protein